MVVALRQYLLPAIALILLASGQADDFLEPPRLEAQIRLLRQVYRIHEAVPVRFTVINKGTRPVTLHLAKKTYRSFRFRVRSLQNIPVKLRKEFQLRILAERASEPRSRTLVLHPGERYGRVINLAARHRLVRPRHYEITGYFYLKPMRSEQDPAFTSNRVRFILKPPLPVEHLVRKQRRKSRIERLRRRSPMDTVRFTIRSKMAREWDNYFKYIDLPRLIDVFGQFRERYRAASVNQRVAIIEEFKQYMKTYPSERILGFFVSEATVKKDEKSHEEEATVKCRITYKNRKGLVEKKMYHFSLYQRMDRWFIYRYWVHVMN